MIFVTVGSSISFDRLILAVDKWAGLRERTDVIAQIGQTDYKPQNIKAFPLVDPSEFRKYVIAAQLVVAHAGMGSIITALELGKPILVMPRRAQLKETRNDHQVATAVQFAKRQGVIVAMDERELPIRLDQAGNLGINAKINVEASPELIVAIRSFISAT